MSKNESQQIEAALEQQARLNRKRKLAFIILGALVAKGALAYGAYQWLYLSRYVSTDNAYTAAEMAQVTPTVSGIVRDVRVVDTQAVKAGDVVALLDDTDARLALDQAEADLGRAIRRVRGYVASDWNLGAQAEARAALATKARAQAEAAQSDLIRARVDLERREALAASGSVSGDEITRARNAFESAAATLEAARAAERQAHADYIASLGARAANAVLILGTDEDHNPEVALARAKRDQAAVNLERTVIRAPVDGVIAKRSVQVGQQVQAGTPLLSVVPIAAVHVDANFKEGQLEKVRIGQPVELRSDLYGKHATYHGVIEGLAGGTGATFATIPAQNATGNWIKVVQRVPVRIRLDASELSQRPLQVGLSMTATVDTKSRT
jgi:membrane fusion protein (multidrug efflux system)